MLAPRPDYVTEDDFLKLPESLDKVELIDGEVITSPAPSARHQALLVELVYRLRLWSSQRSGVRVLCAPTDIRFAPGRMLQPDVVVFLKPVDLDSSPIDQVPEVCVEVVSPGNRPHDTLTKRLVYAAAGVSLYWIVDPRGHVEHWSGEHLDVGRPVVEALDSPLLPGFRLTLSELFSDR